MSRVQHTLRTVQELLGKGQCATALQAVQLALRRDPGQPFLVHAMAVTLHRLGELEKALHVARPLVKAHPNVADVHCTLGMILAALGRFDEAVVVLERAVELNPRSGAALMELGTALSSTPRKYEALRVCRRAMELEPENPEAVTRLLLALHSASCPEDEVAVARAALARFPNHYNAAVAAAVAGNYLSETTQEQSLQDHREVGTMLTWLTGAAPHHFTGPRDPGKRLRVGFLSGDFRTHSVAFFLEPLLAALDRQKVEVFLYSATRPEDARTERFRELADTWRPVFGSTGLPLARTIRSDGVDILVELGGLTGAHLLPALEHRGAPVQATYLGYPNTTGLGCVDYRLVDSRTDPDGAERWCTERLTRLDGCFLCYAAPPEAPAPARAAHAGVTFGSFNALQKVSNSVVALWARLLSEVPGSRLLLKTLQFGNEEPRARTRELFARAGVGADRLELVATTPTLAEHLALYGRIDVAVDTFPYGGTTTTCEALWMGVPVVTLAGAAHASRVGASLLETVGAPELVATDPDGYVRIAADLAGDGARLDGYRAELRGKMASSALCDAPGHARRFERALREMWQEWCSRG